jgi:hypothetical protein
MQSKPRLILPPTTYTHSDPDKFSAFPVELIRASDSHPPLRYDVVQYQVFISQYTLEGKTL